MSVPEKDLPRKASSVIRTGSPWPVTLKVDEEDLASPRAVGEARQKLGPAPPAP